MTRVKLHFVPTVVYSALDNTNYVIRKTLQSWLLIWVHVIFSVTTYYTLLSEQLS